MGARHSWGCAAAAAARSEIREEEEESSTGGCHSALPSIRNSFPGANSIFRSIR